MVSCQLGLIARLAAPINNPIEESAWNAVWLRDDANGAPIGARLIEKGVHELNPVCQHLR